VEGRSYTIKKFQVSRQARKYNPVPNPQTIYFTPWTVLEEIRTELDTQLPLYVFNFVDFEELDRRRRNEHGLIGIHYPCLAYSGSLFLSPGICLSGAMVFGFSTDVIGQLTIVHPVLRSSGLNGVSVRRVVELRDLRLLP
jgi:hypothetical protein